MQTPSMDLMCSPVPQTEAPLDCAEECKASATVWWAQESIVPYVRFCWMTCTPSNGQKMGGYCKQTITEVKSDLENEIVSQSVGIRASSGSANLMPGPTLDERAPQQASGFEEAPPERAHSQAFAEAREGRMSAAAVEADAAEALATSAGALANASDALRLVRRHVGLAESVRAQLAASAVRASAYARRAEEAAARARAELREMAEAPREAAAEAARAAVAELRRRRNQSLAIMATVEAAMQPPTPQATEVGDLAMAPHHAAMQRSAGMGHAYIAQAESLSRQAKDLQRRAEVASGQAAAYQIKDEPNRAPQMSAHAKDLFGDVKKAYAQAGQEEAIAERINSDVPSLEASAAAAATYASERARRWWIPPLVPHPGLSAPSSSPGAAADPAVPANALTRHIRGRVSHISC